VTPICISKIGELRNAQGPLNFPHIYQISVYKFARLNDLRICTPVCRNSTVKLEVKTAFYKLKKIRRIILVGAPRFELGTSCAQGSSKKSILLVRLALFCVMVHAFGPNWAVVGPKLDPSLSDQADSRHARSRRLFEGTRSCVARITLPTPQRSCVPIVRASMECGVLSTNPNP
jgi:hypothetical protein